MQQYQADKKLLKQKMHLSITHTPMETLTFFEQQDEVTGDKNQKDYVKDYTSFIFSTGYFPFLAPFLLECCFTKAITYWSGKGVESGNL